PWLKSTSLHASASRKPLNCRCVSRFAGIHSSAVKTHTGRCRYGRRTLADPSWRNCVEPERAAYGPDRHSPHAGGRAGSAATQSENIGAPVFAGADKPVTAGASNLRTGGV